MRSLGYGEKTKAQPQTETPEPEKVKPVSLGVPPSISPRLTQGKGHRGEIQLTFMFVRFFLPGGV